jgi:hypothetical protein
MHNIMDSPNGSYSLRIRRHESLPCSPLRRHATTVLRSRRLGASKNNPYVGSFRHAPPTSLRSMEASGPASVLLSPAFPPGTSGLPATMKSSPYVGWFRHAPSSRRGGAGRCGGGLGREAGPFGQPIHFKVDHEFLAKLDRWHRQLAILLGDHTEGTEKVSGRHSSSPYKQLLRPSLAEIINGRLVGGGKGRLAMTESSGTPTSADPPPGSSATAKLLSRLSSWLLFPLVLYDDEDVTECYHEYRRAHHHHDVGLKLLEEDRAADTDSDDAEEEEEDEHDDDDDDAGSSASSASGRDTSSCPFRGGNGFADVNVSVSEMAESYYAHQLIEERRAARGDHGSSSGATGPAGDHLETLSNGHPLDYVITQMDIARMARNASRHLDVDSILTLPTVTYRKPTKGRRPIPQGTPPNHQSHRQHQHICEFIQDSTSENNMLSSTRADSWSFVMVSGIKSTMMAPPTAATRSTPPRRPLQNQELYQRQQQQSAEDEQDSTGDDNDVCVICLETFQDGDRLRVLPCDHSFHVGCIDRWLSGSHSYNECFTAGCPTCKKRPADVIMTTTTTPPAIVARSSRENQQQPSPAEPRGADKSTQQDAGHAMDGSVPSWAFAQLGSAMAMSSGDFVFDY